MYAPRLPPHASRRAAAGHTRARAPLPACAVFKHDTDGDNTISFQEFQKQMNTIRPKRPGLTGKSAASSLSVGSTTSSMGSKATPKAFGKR